MKKILVILLLIGVQTSIFAQDYNVVKEKDALRKLYRKEIRIPNIGDYETLKCDFHIHTIFSDGSVWPTIRVQEAYYEGLDAIAITDHIENQPSKKHIGGDQNSAYEIAKPEAENLNLLLVKAGEITRGMPPGHLNALFVADVAALETEKYMDAIKEANNQGAFVMWNHPGWQAMQPDTCKWWDIHEEIYKRGWLHGIEVYNWDEWYPISFDWCINKNLSFIANSDIHIVASHRFNYERYKRPMTLVFAEIRNLDGLKDAMFEKRTVAFFANQLAGPENLLKQLFEASIKIKKPFKTEKEIAFFEISNPTDLTFILENGSPKHKSPKKIEIFPGSTVIVKCAIPNESITLPYTITNLHSGMGKNLTIELPINK